MTPAALLVVLIGLTFVAYLFGKARAVAVVGGARKIRNLHSLPSYYGALTALWCALPAIVVLATWVGFQDRIIIGLVTQEMSAETRQLPPDQLGLVLNDVRNVVAGGVTAASARPEAKAAAARYIELRELSRTAVSVLVLVIGIIGVLIVRARISPELRARNSVERIIEYLLIGCSLIAVLTTIGIIASVAFEAARFFGRVPWYEFLFGLQWSPQTAIRADQVGSSGAFGAVPLFWGTIMISGIAMSIAVPIGLFSAIYLAEYANRRFRSVVKPLLEVLAGVPTVVYGFFAALTIGPALRAWGESIGLDVASESALAAGLVMGIMIVPFVSSLADDMITAVPQSLRDGAYALGATRSETIRQVVFEAVTTVTVQIVTLLVGDQEFDSPKTLAAFALGLVLFIVTLVLNVLALHIVRKYREQYE
jgi:phosphate transport system permease protein